MLGFDYLRLQHNEELLWQYGIENFSFAEFFYSIKAYPSGDTVISNAAGRIVDITVNRELVQQSATVFPSHILGPDYSGPRTVIIRFYVPD